MGANRSAANVCTQCGKEYDKPADWKGRECDWQRRRYCSVACRVLAWESTHDAKRTCAWCGESFSIHPKRPDQKTCSRKCGHALANRRGRMKREPYVVVDGRRCPVCACGNAATTQVYFYTLTSSGLEIPQALDVCADCRQYMLENDGGCSAAPLPKTGKRSPFWSPIEGGE